MTIRIYIAGPMTGIDLYNFPAFDEASKRVRELGHIPVSPAALDRAIGFDPADPISVETVRIDKDFMYAAIRRDVDALLSCDAILMLDGWTKSRGANGERTVAIWAGIAEVTFEQLEAERAKAAAA